MIFHRNGAETQRRLSLFRTGRAIRRGIMKVNVMLPSTPRLCASAVQAAILRPAVLVIVLIGSVTADGADPDLGALEERAFKQATALVGPSIVRIQTVGGLDRVGEVLTGTGPTTGVAVSQDGYIISSAFNFISKPSSILVELPDGRRLPAAQVATDRSRMLTLLKIEADDLVPAPAAEKDSVRVGQWSLALGRTYSGTAPSISVGIVSALDRIWGKAVQTDAKVSPVNYGGPLVGIDGKVLGILVPLSPQGSEETAGVEWYDGGIGFAIPMQDVYAAVERLKSGEDLKPGLMGIEFGSRDRLAGEPKISRVRIGSPAEKGGLKADDLIVEVDGKPVDRQAEVQLALGSRYAGDTVRVSVKRGEETIEKELTLVGELLPYESAFLGILPDRSPVAPQASLPGVGVRHVFDDSPAAKTGLQADDRVTRFNGVEVGDAPSLLEQVGRLRPGEKATVEFTREGESKSAEVELASIPETVPNELRAVFIPRPDEGEKPADADAEQPADEAAEAGRPKTGRFTETPEGRENSYWAYVPEDYNPAYRYGLMVWIHPGDDTMEATLMKQWRGICDQRGIIILAPKARRLGNWTPNEAEFVKDMTAEFLETYSIDPARVFLHSHADGGPFAYHLAFKYRDLYRGVAAVAAPMRSRPEENHPDHRLQFHLVCGEKDSQLPAVKATVEALRTMKFPVSFTTIADRDRKYPGDEQVQEIARWADCLDRI